jgi:hypothetical protein
MHNPYVVRTGVFDWLGLKDKNPDMTDRILGLAGLRIELTWLDQSRELQDDLRPQGMPAHKQYWPIYERKLVIQRSRHGIRGHGPLDSLTVTFSEGFDRGLNASHFQYAKEQGWPYDQEALFAATDHTQTWTDVQKIRITSGLWKDNTRSRMQLVLQGSHGEEIKTIALDNEISVSRRLTRQFAQRLTEVLQLRRVGGVDPAYFIWDEYTVV